MNSGMAKAATTTSAMMAATAMASFFSAGSRDSLRIREV